ncbi:rhodanese-like domain-containing protein [Flavobacterium sp.]|uniref:rhodanese-like domain-containing protein n=1 Tax=Flavobacterium sp. TaxID=239 RepID=UPI003527D839
MKKYPFLVLFVTSFFLFSCLKNHSQVAVADVATFEALQKENNVQLLDVRTAQEYNESHLKNALNIDVNSDSFTEKASQLDKQKPVLVYCRSGHRSAKAAQQLKELGFTQVTDLDGGILAWKKENKPVVKE